ncbi:hypothetical protein CXF68_18515 [Tenacibaculum sp. Bg11-29]|uniref:hypothetical protein n=1 Tax=Tenacibaculum sp. Bg11-29 TaxID=2058306 RepID=UPI000C3456FB|nr:hypothetical protein [Tenacibaculum sp. Bg11-29]PKH52571.1 hypothetical protein CXF68_18515 [Tenacibaculum sp. Bg11-29]
MRKLISILILLLFTACWHKSYKLVDNYRGYIYDSKNTPLEKVRIYERHLDSAKYVYTDKNGYFLLKGGSSTFVDDLVLEKEGYITDTVFAFSYNGGRVRNITRFLMEWSDTVRMREVKRIDIPNNGNN